MSVRFEVAAVTTRPSLLSVPFLLQPSLVFQPLCSNPPAVGIGSCTPHRDDRVAPRWAPRKGTNGLRGPPPPTTRCFGRWPSAGHWGSLLSGHRPPTAQIADLRQGRAGARLDSSRRFVLGVLSEASGPLGWGGQSHSSGLQTPVYPRGPTGLCRDTAREMNGTEQGDMWPCRVQTPAATFLGCWAGTGLPNSTRGPGAEGEGASGQ